jgi:hypothetical protein
MRRWTFPATTRQRTAPGLRTTRDPLEAKRRHAAALAAIEQRWTNLRAPVRKLDQTELHQVTVTTYERCVAVGGPPDIIWDTKTGGTLWEDALDMGAAIQRHWCQQRAGEYAAAFGLRLDDDDLRKIAKAIGIGAQKAALILERQAKGDFSPEGSTSVVSSVKPVAFSALLDGWAVEKQPTQKTISSWQKVLEQFGTFVGHTDAARLTPENLLHWKAALLAAGFRTKTIRDSKIAPVRAILQWGVDNRKISTNLAARVVMDVHGKMSERIRGFSDAEAVLILRQAASERDPVRRWIPVLCAYSGARIAEICQLRGEDIIQQAGIWCMKFDPAAGALKNVNSERAVPLHPAIVASGFLEFVAASRRGHCFRD